MTQIPTPTPGTAASTSVPLEDRPRVLALKARIGELLEDAIVFWLRHGHDREHGGFHATLDRFGRPIEPSNKGLVQQSRHLWTFSACCRQLSDLNADRRAALRDFAYSAFRFVVQHFLDPSDGEFFHLVDRRGKPVDCAKHLYSNSFAIYGLAEYALALRSDQAKQLALRCFESIDRTSHDAIHGGYDQSDRPNWLGPASAKDTNTHIHLMEAFTNLYRATLDHRVRDRAAELVRLVLTRHIQPSGQTHAEFACDFTPLGPPTISYGHDIETAWLLFDAIDILGLDGRDDWRKRAFALGKNAADAGFDREKGGFFEEGIPGGGPTKLEKIWWVQVEAIAGLYCLYQYCGDPNYLVQLERTLDYVERYLRDPNQGEWYWGVLPDGSLGQHGDNKCEEWKSSYHLVRGLMFTQNWMTASLSVGA